MAIFSSLNEFFKDNFCFFVDKFIGNTFNWRLKVVSHPKLSTILHFAASSGRNGTIGRMEHKEIGVKCSLLVRQVTLRACVWPHTPPPLQRITPVVNNCNAYTQPRVCLDLSFTPGINWTKLQTTWRPILYIRKS